MITSSEILLNIHLDYEECILLKEILNNIKNNNLKEEERNLAENIIDDLDKFLQFN